MLEHVPVGSSGSESHLGPVFLAGVLSPPTRYVLELAQTPDAQAIWQPGSEAREGKALILGPTV